MDRVWRRERLDPWYGILSKHYNGWDGMRLFFLSPSSSVEAGLFHDSRHPAMGLFAPVIPTRVEWGIWLIITGSKPPGQSETTIGYQMKDPGRFDFMFVSAIAYTDDRMNDAWYVD